MFLILGASASFMLFAIGVSALATAYETWAKATALRIRAMF